MHNMIIVAGGIVALVVVVLAIVGFVSRNYIKVAPNQVAVFYGRKYKMADGKIVGFKVITGGAKFKIPILENFEFLDLSIFSIDLKIEKAPNKDNVLVNLEGVANVKILSDEASLMAACERFLHKSPEEIKSIAYKNLEGHLRAIAGSMTIEELINDRTKLNQAVLSDAAVDLRKLGLGIDLLTIQKVTDDAGYIVQLGRQRTAEVTKNANIGTANATKESTIQTTTAEKEAALIANANQVAIAESEKSREVQKALYKAETVKQQAVTAQAEPLAKAQAQKEVFIAEQETIQAQVEKETEVARARANKTEQDLQSTVVKPAEAAKRAAVLQAEQEKEVLTLKAEGEKSKATQEGEGRAAAELALGTAQAKVIELKLVAEATGIEKKAEAYAKLDEAGKLLLILDVIERVAPQVVREFAGVMKEMAAPLGNVDNISIIDFGSGDATGKFAGTVPGMLSKFFTMAQGAGIDLSGILKKIGVDTTGLLEKGNLKPGETPREEKK